MSYPHPTETLMNEHRVIERVLRALEAELSSLENQAFPRAFFDQALDFFANFADGCHHSKEEEKLFPELEKKGLARDGGPLGVMIHEHGQGRLYLAEIRWNLDAAERGETQALATIRRAAESYIHLLREHIWKEDHILFQMARRLLSPEDADRIARQFQGIEQNQAGAGAHKRYLRMAEELAAAPTTRA